jgi:hypothetical protein
MATLDLNPSPKATVFRKICSLIRNDPTIKRIFKPASIRDWSGKAQDCEPFNVSIAPAIRLTPTQGPENWKYPDATKGTLFIKIEMLVWGTDVDDAMNLWYAIERAIYPLNPATTLTNITALQAAGAYSGLAEFPQPAFDPQPDENYFAAVGQIAIDVLIPIFP